MAVDDEETVLDLMIEVLNDLGFHALPASRADEALALMAKTPDVDLLITDIRMPGMSGVDLARQVRAMRPCLPILFVTGFASELEGGVRQWVKDGHLLTKPFTMESFANTIRKMVGAPD